MDKSSAVAEMGDRGHNRHGPKRVGAAVPLSRELGPGLVQCGLGRGLLPYQAASSSIQPLARIDMGQNWVEWVCLFLGVAGSTFSATEVLTFWRFTNRIIIIIITQCRVGRGLLRTKWHLDPCSRLATIDVGRKLGDPPLLG